MKENPVFCVLYPMIRETFSLNVLRFVLIFIGQGTSKLGPAARGISCVTSTAFVVELIDRDLYIVTTFSRSKHLLETSIQSEPPKAVKRNNIVACNILY